MKDDDSDDEKRRSRSYDERGIRGTHEYQRAAYEEQGAEHDGNADGQPRGGERDAHRPRPTARAYRAAADGDEVEGRGSVDHECRSDVAWRRDAAARRQLERGSEHEHEQCADQADDDLQNT